MATAMHDFTSAVRQKVISAWDWPAVPGAGYSDQARDRLKNLSQYFSTVAAVGVSSVCAVYDSPAWVVITAGATGVIAGHYLAGLVTKLQR